jgi:hypothetical protein
MSNALSFDLQSTQSSLLIDPSYFTGRDLAVGAVTLDVSIALQAVLCISTWAMPLRIFT